MLYAQFITNIGAERGPSSEYARSGVPTESFLYDGLLEMADLDLFPHADRDKSGCPVFHLFPRFVRDIAGE